MNLKSLNKFFFILMISSLSFTVFAQSKEQLNNKDFNAYADQALQEKIFAHTDKNFYVCGEILWFKLYDVAAENLKPLNLSNIAYVEILNAQQKPVLQAMIALKNGTGTGSFYLPSSVVSGNYIFRAYTNWMKNFSANLYFQKQITIVNTLTQVHQSNERNNDEYGIGFYPEGGNFINGIQSKVGFKITDEYGNGISCSGKIIDEKKRSIISFSTLKFGMGSFYFKPEKNHVYNAVINVNGKSITKNLPVADNTGCSMHLLNEDEKQLTVTITSGTDFQKQFYLIAYNNNNVSAALIQSTDNNGKALFTIDKSNLRQGITHLIVFNNAKQPLCERLIFIKPQPLQLNISADKNLYEPRSEVKMNVSANDSADISMSVYLIDSLQLPDDNNILSYLWLSSALKGKIESPQYYFNNNNAEADSALENLLLTQGWIKFKAANAENSQPFLRFAPEHEGHIIEGKVTNKTTGLPAKNIRVYLSVPGQHFRFASAVSNDTGFVFFDVKDFYGAAELVVQTAKEDSIYRVEITSPFSNQLSNWHTGVFNFSENKVQQLSKHNLAMQVQNAYTINQLNRFNSPALDSNAFYGKADETYFLDNYVRFNTMEEVLREYVAQVNVKMKQGKYAIRIVDARNNDVFENNPLVMVDGVPVFDMNKVLAYNPLKIKKAEVINGRYYLNSLYANGILSFSTYKGDLDGFQFDPGTVELSYDGLQLQREFYLPQYITQEQKQSRLPDYRNVLYWSPQIITNNTAQISFYTSDVKGRYIAVVQGINPAGKAGFSTTDFEVK